MSFTKEESFSLEIEAEREYVHRLKIQREKVCKILYRLKLYTRNMMFCWKI